MAFLYSIDVVNRLFELALKLRTGLPFEMSDNDEASLIEDAITIIHRKDRLIKAYNESCDEQYHAKLDALATARDLKDKLERAKDEYRALSEQLTKLEHEYLALAEREDNRSKLFDRIADMADLAIMGSDEDIANMTKEM